MAFDKNNPWFTYEEEAFRIELLPVYKVIEEKRPFEDFVKFGKINDNEKSKNRREGHAKLISEGKRHIRARLIPEEFNDYFLFELKAGYIPQSRVGIEFIFLEKNKNLMKCLGNYSDFWLFDKKFALLMKYDNDGIYLGYDYSENPEIIDNLIKIRDFAVNNGKTLSYILDKVNGLS